MRRHQIRLRAGLAGLLALVPLVALRAEGSLEFRSDGFFGTTDAQVRFFHLPWEADPHLDVKGEKVMSFTNPILQPGYNSLTSDGFKITTDPARLSFSDSGTLGKLGTPCHRTFSEYMGGMLARIEFDQPSVPVEQALTRFIFPVAVMAGHKASWTGGETVLPAAKPEPGHFFFANSPDGTITEFRFDIGNGKEFGVKFLSPVKNVSLSDCREWNEANYHLQATYTGRVMLVYMCILKPGEPFPAVKAPANQPAPEIKTAGDAAIIAVPGSDYGVSVLMSGQLMVTKKGSPLFNIESPIVQDGGQWVPIRDPASFNVKDNRVEVISGVKGKPYKVRQSIGMDAEGWLDNTVTFEGTEGHEAQVALSMMEKDFAGKAVLADGRVCELPKTAGTNSSLFDDFNGRVLEYVVPQDAPDHISLFCDQVLKSSINDSRLFSEPAFKITLAPKEGTAKYRVHFWKEEGPQIAEVKGNMLKDGDSFEVGPEGVQPYACTSWNEKMVEPNVPPVFDTTTAQHGSTSLLLTATDSQKLGDPRGFTFTTAVFNRVPVKRGHKYTVSAWLKADRPGVKANIYSGEMTWGGNDWPPISVTTEWQRYHFTFYASNFKTSAFYLTWVGLDPSVKAGKLWIDSVQLEEGDLTDYKPASEVEYGVESTREDKLFDKKDACSAVFRARNNGTAPLAQKVPYVIKDYWENVVKSGTVAVNVPPGKSVSFPVDLGKLPGGYYRGYFMVPDGGPKELIFGVYEPQPLTQLPDDWPLACHNDPAPLVRKIGFGSVRAFEIFEILSIAPGKDKLDFTRADRMVSDAEKAGLTVMPILSEFAWPSWAPEPSIPSYAAEKTEVNVLPDGSQRRLTWPKIDEWKNYVRAVTSHYKGRIKYWEVLNEPNLAMTPKQYLPYLQASYEAAKEGNPDCQVVGICGTSDSTGKPDDFTQGVLDLGGAKYFDLMSVHLYNTKPPENTLEVGSDKLLNKWRSQVKEKFGKDTVVWCTEKSFTAKQLGYTSNKNYTPLEYCDEPQFLVDTFKSKAEYLLRETILDSLGGGKGRFYWFGVFDYGASFINVRNFQPYGLNHTEYDQSPFPDLIAANGLARVLTGMSHPFRQINLNDAVYTCIFNGEKGSVAAIWNWKGKSRVAIPVGKTPFAVRNFFGEPIDLKPDAQGNLVIDAESAPKYVVLAGSDGETAAKLISQSKSE